MIANEVNIQLSGLSDLQCVIADFLWEVQTDEDMSVVYETFGEDNVEVIKQLMVAEAFDEVVDLTEANEVLRLFY
jgi:hypothetical protein